jgi:hypothetical protein
MLAAICCRSNEKLIQLLIITANIYIEENYFTVGLIILYAISGDDLTSVFDYWPKCSSGTDHILVETSNSSFDC